MLSGNLMAYAIHARAQLKKLAIVMTRILTGGKSASVRALLTDLSCNLGVADASAVYDPQTDRIYVSCGYTEGPWASTGHVYALEDRGSRIELKAVARLEQPRWGAAASLNPLDGSLIFIGGHTEEGPSSVITKFDPLSGEVQDVDVGVPIGRGCMADFVPEWCSILVAVEHPKRLFLIYDCKSGSVRTVRSPWPDIPTRWGNMTYYGSLIFITGGSVSRGRAIIRQPYMRVLRALEGLRLRLARSSVTPFALHRMNREAVTYGGFILLGFGLDGLGKFHGQVLLYDASADAYYWLGRARTSRDGVASAFDFKVGRAYFVGGRNSRSEPKGLTEVTVVDLRSEPVDAQLWAEPCGDNRYAVLSGGETPKLHLRLANQLDREVSVEVVVLRGGEALSKRVLELSASEITHETFKLDRPGLYSVLVSGDERDFAIRTNVIRVVRLQ